MKPKIFFALIALTTVLFTSRYSSELIAQPPNQRPTKHVIARENVSLVHPQNQRWRFGMEITSPGLTTGISATITLPLEWPEQKVVIVSQEKSENVRPIRMRTLGNGVQQGLISITRLNPGESANVYFTIDVERSIMEAPQSVTGLACPDMVPAAVRKYLLVSPFIEMRDPSIVKVSREVGYDAENDWQRVELIYDWVRERIRYEFDEEQRGAAEALKVGVGDCEELTSLFIAMCRNNGIPARAVWIPGHCYPEFYLENAAGQGFWFPCQAAGTRAFGAMPEYRPVLQKGDSIRVPGNPRPQRYVAETLKAVKATANPVVKFIRERVDTKNQLTPDQ